MTQRYVLFRCNGHIEGMTLDFAPTLRDMQQAISARCLAAAPVIYNGQAAVLIFDLAATKEQRPVNLRSTHFLPVEISGDFAIILGFHFDEVLYGRHQDHQRRGEAPIERTPVEGEV